MVKTEKVKKDEEDAEYIVQKSELIIDEETGERYVTITISSKILHFIFAGLGKYKEGFKSDSSSDREEKDKSNKIIDEFTKVKSILNSGPT